MKRMMSILLVLAMMLALTACSAADPEPTAAPAAAPETEATAAPAETAPETAAATEPSLPPLDLSGFELTDMEKTELERACSLGIPMDKLGQETIRAVEYVDLIDHFVEAAEPEKLDQWKEMFPLLRRSTMVLSRFEALMITFLAADMLGEEYYTLNMTANEAMDKSKLYKMNWNIPYIQNWELYGEWEAVNSKDYVLGTGMVFDHAESACYYFNVGKVSYTSFESMFSFDRITASMRPKDDCTYMEAVLALSRLYDACYENVYGE